MAITMCSVLSYARANFAGITFTRKCTGLWQEINLPSQVTSVNVVTTGLIICRYLYLPQDTSEITSFLFNKYTISTLILFCVYTISLVYETL